MITVSLYCPAMAVLPVDGCLKRTAAEPMTAKLTWESDGSRTVPNIIIPPTDIVRIGLLHWQVADCVGQDAGGLVFVQLPAEPVFWDAEEFTMVAQPITAPITIKINGTTYRGFVQFPACKTNLLTGVAESVTATGSAS